MLYIIPTPIGNRDDITLRALQLLESLTIFFCEDTRTTKKLLSMYQIDTKNKKFYVLTSFSKTKDLNYFTELMQKEDIGLVSEAGSPGLSDPGKNLIQICHQEGIPFSILPGANALVPAVVASGFDTSQFVFLGFFPQKKGRKKLLEKIVADKLPYFFYESVHRLEKLITELEESGFQGKISIAREISKKFEQYLTTDLETIKSKIQEGTLPIKGEFVVGLFPNLKKEQD